MNLMHEFARITKMSFYREATMTLVPYEGEIPKYQKGQKGFSSFYLLTFV